MGCRRFLKNVTARLILSRNYSVLVRENAVNCHEKGSIYPFLVCHADKGDIWPGEKQCSFASGQFPPCGVIFYYVPLQVATQCTQP